jgi:cytoskeletal protein CcmA (bactofilin family)
VPLAILARPLLRYVCPPQLEEISMTLFSRRPARPASTGYSVIDDQLSISGDLHTEGTVRVDGRVEGTLHRADTLIIGAGGSVVGNIEAREVVIGGDVCGSLIVTGRVEVQASATVQGDIHAAAVMLQEGGTVHGHVAIHPIGSDVQSIPTERRLALTPSHAIQAVAQG